MRQPWIASQGCNRPLWRSPHTSGPTARQSQCEHSSLLPRRKKAACQPASPRSGVAPNCYNLKRRHKPTTLKVTSAVPGSRTLLNGNVWLVGKTP